MEDFNQYIKISDLKNGYAYKICSRNAYVGIWSADKSAFIVSRYGFSDKPYVCEEYHCDILLSNEILEDNSINIMGTAKPLHLIEKAPFENFDNELLITSYLDNLEMDNPIIDGYNSVLDRRKGTKSSRLFLK